MILLVIAVYAALVALDVRRDRRSGKPWIVWPCLALFGLGFAIQALHELHAEIPSPAGPISEFITGAFGLR